MEVKKSLNRFVSITLIVALGVAFYSGIQSAAPDMRYTGDAYFDEHKLMDLKVVGSLGLTEGDVEALSQIEGIAEVEPGYMLDVLCGNDDARKVLHLEAICPTLNQLTPTEGRVPEKSGEVFVDIEFLDKSPYEIGDTITFYREKEEDLTLKRDVYTIVGAGSSPLYISFDRGNTTLGNGEISGAAYILPEDFDSEVYTQIYMEVEESRNLTAYTDAYDTLIETVKDRVEDISGERCDVRYREVMDEANEKLADAKQELEDGKKEAESELADARREIADAEKKIRDGIRDLNKGKKEIEDAESELADGEQEIADNKVTLAEKEQELADGKTQLADGWNRLAAGKQELASQEASFNKTYASSMKEIKSGEEQLKAAKEKLAAGKTQYEQAKADYENGLSQYQAGEEAYARGLAEYEAQAGAWPAKKQELSEQKAGIEAQKAELEAQKPAAEEARANLQGQLDEVNGQLAGIQGQAAELEAQIGSLSASVESWNDQISQQNGLLAQAQQNLDAVDDSFENAEELRAQYTAEINSARAEIERLNGEIANARGVMASLQGQLDELNGQIGALRGIQAELQNGIAQADAGIGQLEEGIQAAIAGISQIEAGIAQGDQEIAAEKQQLDESRAQLDATKQQLDAAPAELEKAAAEIETGRQEITANEKKLKSGRQKLESGKRRITQAKNTLAASEQTLINSQAEITNGEWQLADGWQKLADAEQELEDGRKEIADAKKEIEDAEKELEDGRKELEDGKKEYEDGKKEAEEEIADGEQKIADAEEEIADIEEPEWMISDRSSLPENIGYGENADRIRAIGQVFPVLFFLVAALISLTTMTRMVEEERTQIGTLKALGYSKASIAFKYILYAMTATVTGSVLGILFGEKFLPYVIVTAYGIMYHHMTTIQLPYNMTYAMIGSGAALVATIGATIASCYKELSAEPAVLMRPPAPKEGKRVFLERIPVIWKRLNFTWKSTVRNLLRYKKRFFMTVFGIGGCMALMIVGYGIRDSIQDIARLQYEELQLYKGMVIMKSSASREEKAMLEGNITTDDRVKDSMNMLMEKEIVRNGKKKWDIYLMVPEEADRYGNFVNFRDRTTKEEFELSDEGAILTEKIAKMMGVGVGDTITVESEDFGAVEIPIAAITENYLSHYIYLTPAVYERCFGKQPEYNEIIYQAKEEYQDEVHAMGEDFLREEAALSISYTDTIASQLDDMLSALDFVIIVLIVSAGLLAFVVLYNLNNININERKRELATIKVLGFYDGEVSAYVYRENILITIIGIGAGILLGTILHRFIITTVEVDDCMFGRNINLISFMISSMFTVAFSVFVNVVMHFKLKKIDMVESLKSVE